MDKIEEALSYKKSLHLYITGTWIKRLVRKTICFSKSIQMHDLVIGLFVNLYAHGSLIFIRVL
jgi:hypothetical protein